VRPLQPETPGGISNADFGKLVRWGSQPTGVQSAINALTPEIAKGIVQSVGADLLYQWITFYQAFAIYVAGLGAIVKSRG
jgi:hypothetical protein